MSLARKDGSAGGWWIGSEENNGAEDKEMKKHKIIENGNYWLVDLENDFIREFKIKGADSWSLYEHWHNAISLYMHMHKAINGKYPDYNTEFMQALAMSDIGTYFLINEFMLEHERVEEYYERRKAA